MTDDAGHGNDAGPGRTGGQAGRRARTREALLDAGLSLLAARPVEALSVDEIVAHAGVAKGSFFNHFSNKPAFFEAVSGRVRAALEHEITRDNRGERDAALRVARAVSRVVAFAFEHPRAAGVLARAGAAVGRADHPLNAGVLADLDAGLAAGQFDIAPREAGVLAIIGVSQALLCAALWSGQDRAVVLGQTVSLIRALLRGLGLDAPAAAAAADRAVADALGAPAQR